ncbi:tRNA preQ1(34) S-adenosylmethionine ribosyltransferase-isomerase QueA [Oceanomicrobium pacificus]|uniref:S-adenosylmethionine:tRNA ribosyltransferase-isomerase n=1 Tax=Oceanomicrobium pacificus TaxID=2692916 RepID=A0A6B0TSP3_9RHOB|nr:tRNA preQ1(34) S-adenosylmethionine ribosyltransferase-isomerase QueA [Oceanomicrobium pacificus]MXU65779.1 tRNA preQ1(34) S-adenosylmethionine ribosyltransferase-isomerase QueA [Oceanomicrobium pacificus]
MRLSDFDFDLPEELIALRPVSPRSSARLLVAEGGATMDRQVMDLPAFLRPGDLLVFNNTRVLPTRLDGLRKRETPHGSGEARIEVTLIEQGGPARWTALARPARKLAEGDIVRFSDSLSATVEARRDGGEVDLAFDKAGADLVLALEDVGRMPLPPYIESRRPADHQDRDDYQTIFARRDGAVAAPTASLHFDDTLLAALDAHGVGRTEVTLHVGAGTFLPVKTDVIDEHKMHAEWGEVTEEAANAMRETWARGGRVIPVGTTSLRLIESAATAHHEIGAWSGDTDIFIRPGYRFLATDGLMTNFHLPKSTLLMLVSALMGMDRMRALYAHAIEGRYRFFSYGDSSLLIPG